MVRTRPRPPAPPELVRNQQQWTNRFQSGKEPWATDSAKSAILGPLIELTHRKCAFCEGALWGGQSYPRIEHYHPKSKYKALVFEWTNLFPICEVCNTVKADNDHSGQLLKPDIEDPEPFFYLTTEGELKPNNHRAALTIELYKLNRGGLVASRRHMMKRLKGDPDEWVNGDLGDPATPFKFVLRSYLERANRKDLADQDRQRFES